jgi:hypothetical protein
LRIASWGNIIVPDGMSLLAQDFPAFAYLAL